MDKTQEDSFEKEKQTNKQRQSPNEDTFTAAHFRVGYGCTSSGTAPERWPGPAFKPPVNIKTMYIMFFIFFSDTEIIKLSKNNHKFKIC